MADDEEMVDRRLAVGFADLVGFTRLTRRLEEEELGELVESFETTSADLVAAHGGRLIKTLGDEVLTRIVMPICEELVDLVFAGVRAIHASLEREAGLAPFHFFVLWQVVLQRQRRP